MPELGQLGFRFLHRPDNDRRITARHTDLLDHILDDPVVTNNEYGQKLPHLLQDVVPSAITTLPIRNMPSVEQKRCQALLEGCRW